MGRKKKNTEEPGAAPKMEETTGRDPKERIFATPQTGDEAEPDLPPLELLANGYNLIDLSKGEYKIKTKEDIINSGTALQRIRLLISNIDLNGYFEAKEELTKEERAKIIASLQTNEERKLLEVCVKEYETISKFGKLLSYFFKRFQTSYAILAVLLNKWDSYEYTAKQLTLLYNTMRTSFLTIWEEDETGQPTDTETIELYTDSTINNFIQDLIHTNVFDGATLLFNDNTEKFYISVKEKGGLYSQILEEAKSATKDLSDFKAYTIVAEDFIKKSTLKYMPISIQQSIENAEEERYTRYLVKNRRYFRSELNQRIAKGEPVTPEEEKRAVIPDFYEVKPSKNVLADCKAAIKDM